MNLGLELLLAGLRLTISAGMPGVMVVMMFVKVLMVMVMVIPCFVLFLW